MANQFDLFGAAPAAPDFPEGFRYRPDLIDAARERALVAHFADLPFREFEFHGYTGKRRVVSFGYRYDYTERRIERVAPVPEFLFPLRDAAAAFAGLAGDAIAQALITEYSAGSAIGWHRDKREYGDIMGVSLLTPCTFRLRRAIDDGWERVSLIAEPRSVYLMSGASRAEWEHSIPPVEALRYSVTFRTLRAPNARADISPA